MTTSTTAQASQGRLRAMARQIVALKGEDALYGLLGATLGLPRHDRDRLQSLIDELLPPDRGPDP